MDERMKKKSEEESEKLLTYEMARHFNSVNKIKRRDWSCEGH